jgi:hypothetical protein
MCSVGAKVIATGKPGVLGVLNKRGLWKLLTDHNGRAVVGGIVYHNDLARQAG